MAQSYQLGELGQKLTANVSSNLITFDSALAIGNSTVDLVVNSSSIQIGNSTVNSTITTDTISFGNSSQNVIVNSTSVYLNGSKLTGTNLQFSFTSSNSWANTHSWSNTLPSTNANSGVITVVGGVGVWGNVYTGGVFGFSNTANVSVVYQYYNATTNSLDTVFG